MHVHLHMRKVATLSSTKPYLLHLSLYLCVYIYIYSSHTLHTQNCITTIFTSTKKKKNSSSITYIHTPSINRKKNDEQKASSNRPPLLSSFEWIRDATEQKQRRRSLQFGGGDEANEHPRNGPGRYSERELPFHGVAVHRTIHDGAGERDDGVDSSVHDERGDGTAADRVRGGVIQLLPLLIPHSTELEADDQPPQQHGPQRSQHGQNRGEPPQVLPVRLHSGIGDGMHLLGAVHR